jgi:UDP-N-acetylmuramoyl-tripeptide--D-alanyl-D-alanine ligase
MLSNALAAAACGIALGVPVERCAAALSSARVSPWRMEYFDGAGGLLVLNDAYNASPSSMRAALRTARRASRGGRCIAVLGPMAELGPLTEREHGRVGREAARLRIDRLITVGEEARAIARGAKRAGLADRLISCDGDLDEVAAHVRSVARPGDLVLIKGSRIAGLERLAEALRGP